jgi:hypothetical protein
MKSVVGMSQITAGASATLPNLLAAGSPAATIPSGLSAIWLLPAAGAAITMALGATASASTPPVTAYGINLPMDSATAASLQIQGSGACSVLLLIGGENGNALQTLSPLLQLGL